MANLTDPFDAYAMALIQHGHGRDWVRRNEAGLRVRFAHDREPFPVPVVPEPARRGRYEELD